MKHKFSSGMWSSSQENETKKKVYATCPLKISSLNKVDYKIMRSQATLANYQPSGMNISHKRALPRETYNKEFNECTSLKLGKAG
uniref:Uncharacterized protein n=1 Tax=Arundo donax TaxID=35708 RepID=A0A0A8Z7U8_ARUDO